VVKSTENNSSLRHVLMDAITLARKWLTGLPGRLARRLAPLPALLGLLAAGQARSAGAWKKRAKNSEPLPANPV